LKQQKFIHAGVAPNHHRLAADPNIVGASNVVSPQ
jgi:hypothetical protein